MTISLTYANADETQVIFDYGDGRVVTVPPDWRGEFRDGIGGVVGVLAKGDKIKPYVAPDPGLPDLKSYQFYSMLELSGHKAALEEYINGLPHKQKIVARNKLEHIEVFRRNNALVLAAKTALGLTDTELDALWLQASAIE